MSSNIYWRPYNPDRARVDLGKNDDTLKLILRETYGYPLNQVFGKEDVALFKGMLLAGVKDAGKVIEHIKKYDSIIIFEE